MKRNIADALVSNHAILADDVETHSQHTAYSSNRPEIQSSDLAALQNQLTDKDNLAQGCPRHDESCGRSLCLAPNL